jgi:hypothetical protein
VCDSPGWRQWFGSGSGLGVVNVFGSPGFRPIGQWLVVTEVGGWLVVVVGGIYEGTSLDRGSANALGH